MLLLAGLVPLVVVIGMIALLMGFRTAYHALYIPSSSMSPTLRVGDRVLFDKVSYHSHNPERGDIVAYYPPEEYGKRSDDLASQLGKITGLPFLPNPTTFVHRVVAIPGDKVEVVKGDGVFVNTNKVKYYIEPPNYDLRKLGQIGVFAYTNGKPPFPNDEHAIVVPPGQYFVLGDNINNAMDSHIMGFIPRQDIVSKMSSILSRLPLKEGDDPRYAE